MELTHIKYFLEVARTEHVTQSARNLCIVQPALTHAIHKLEDELGVKLFKTQGRIADINFFKQVTGGDNIQISKLYAEPKTYTHNEYAKSDRSD